MEGSITLNELGIFVIFGLIVAVGVYVVVTLRNINGLIKDLTLILNQRRDHFSRIISNIHEISDNTAIISKELTHSVDEAGTAIRKISSETADTILSINETADYLAKYAIVIGEIVKAVVNMFSSDKKY